MAIVRNKNIPINKTLKNILQIDVLNFIVLNLSPSFVDEEEMHDFWEMVYIKSGKATALAGNSETNLSAGDLLFHKPWEIHAIKATQDEPFTAFFISFSSTSEATKAFESLKISLRSEHKKLLDDIYNEARKIYYSRAKDDHGTIFHAEELIPDSHIGSQQIFRMHLEEFLISIMRFVETKENVIYYETKDELDSLIFNKLLDRLKESVYSTISIDELCDEFSCGRTYISQLFKNNTGTSIMNYYNKLKIEEAKRLISEENLSLSHVAESLNFSTQYYFSRVFKRIEGITPTKYKSIHK